MATKEQPKHRMSPALRRRNWMITRATIGLWAGVTHLFRNPLRDLGPVLATLHTLWREYPHSTRGAVLGSIVTTGFVDVILILRPGVPERWWLVTLTTGIGITLLAMIIQGANEQVVALRRLAAVMSRTSSGGPVAAQVQAHCGCTHEYLWSEADACWWLKTVRQSPDCCMIVTI